MEQGLFWLPLLAVFCGLAWMGWNEHQKLTTYQVWAQQFQHTKYDIYAVLGQQGNDLTWGKPSRQGPVNLQTFSLTDVQAVQVLANGYPATQSGSEGHQGKIQLAFYFNEISQPVQIPFTDLELATQWQQHLQQKLKLLRTERHD